MVLNKIILLGNLQSVIMNNELLIYELENATPTKKRVELVKQLKDNNIILSNSMRYLDDLSNLNQRLNNYYHHIKESSLNEVNIKLKDYDRLKERNNILKKQLINL